VDFSGAPRAFRTILGLGVLTWLPLVTGCGGYPELSPAAYELTVVLDNVCALKNEGQLKLVEEMIEKEKAEGGLTAGDEQVLRQIIGIATEGNWDEASRRIRELRLAQNKQAPRGEPVPRKHQHEHDH
jgi:hypothetical protein